MLKHGKSRRIALAGTAFAFFIALAGCTDSPRSLSDIGKSIFGGIGGNRSEVAQLPANPTAGTPPPVRVLAPRTRGGLLGATRTPATPGAGVNAHLWAASLDILGHLPVILADPRTGRIETGFGTAPGASRAYRAIVVIDSAVLDATSLQLALFTTSGPAPAATTAALADAIFARARELRSAGN